MDNQKADEYYIRRMVTDLKFILDHTAELSQAELEANEVLTDSVLFRLIQVSENADKLSSSFRDQRAGIPWRAIKGLRNRIVHEYGKVDLSVVHDAVQKDIPELLRALPPEPPR